MEQLVCSKLDLGSFYDIMLELSEDRCGYYLWMYGINNPIQLFGLLILVSQEVMGQIISALLGAVSIKRVVKSMSETWHTHIVMEGVWGFTPECPKDRVRLMCSVPILSVKTLKGNLRILSTSACPAPLLLWPEAPYSNRSTDIFSNHKNNSWFWSSTCFDVK